MPPPARRRRKTKRKYGTGSIVWKRDRCYYVDRQRPGGKQVWLPAKDEDDAERVGAEFRAKRKERAKVEAPAAVGLSFEDYAAKWLATKKGTAKAGKSTTDGYERILSNHLNPAWGDTALDSITADDVQKYVALKLGGKLDVGEGASAAVAPRTVRNHLSLLGQILGRAIKDGYRPGPNPVEDVDRPSHDFEQILLSQAQFDRLLDEMPVEYKMLTLTLKELGLRLGEALALEWSDYDATKRVLSIRRTLKAGGQIGPPKSKYGRRRLPVSENFHQRLMDHRRTLRDRIKTHDLVFPSPTGNYLSASNFRSRAFRPAVERAFPGRSNARLRRLRIHDLRHTHAGLAIRANVTPQLLSRRMGHHSVRFTLETYGGLYDDQLNEIVDTL